MKIVPQTIERLDRVIAKNCPQLSRRNPSSIRGFSLHIVTLFENQYLAFQMSEDIELLKKLERDLNAVCDSLRSLSAPTRRVLAHRLKPSKIEASLDQIRRSDLLMAAKLPERQNRLELLHSRQTLLVSMRESVSGVRRTRGFKSKARTKPRYDAAAVALACKKIWAEEITGKKPPKRIHFDRSHPMKTFIEQVFDVLEIKGNDGHTFSASTALASLENLGGEETYRLLIESG